MTTFHQLDALPVTQAFPGISFRHVHGEQLTFSVFELEPNAELPRHSHHNEQAGLCTRGSLTLQHGRRRAARRPGRDLDDPRPRGARRAQRPGRRDRRRGVRARPGRLAGLVS